MPTLIYLNYLIRLHQILHPDISPEDDRGGTGDRDDSSAPIIIPNLPSIDISTGSPLYYISSPALKLFQKFIWSTDLTDIVRKYIYEPEQAIISLRVCDFALTKSQPENLVIGNMNTDITVQKISNWVRLNLGSVRLNEYYGMYLDYLPSMSVTLYLPHFGFVNLSLDDVMNCTISIFYNIELYSGSATIEIYSHNNRFNTDILIAQLTTNILMTVPLQFADKNNVIEETMSTISRTATSHGGNAISALNNVIDIATNKQHFSNLSTASNAFGMLSYNEAFLKIERQVAAVPSSYLTEKGFPFMATTKLSKLKGFTKVYSIEHLNIPEMTEEERNELEHVLKEGVIL